MSRTLRWMPGKPCFGVVYYQIATHESVQWSICKTFHNGEPRYTLTRGKCEVLGIFETSDEAKSKAEEEVK